MKLDCDFDLRLLETSQVDWRSLSAVNAVFMQRPYDKSHFEIASLAKLYNRPVWIDYDDDLFSVPPDNPTFQNYGRDEVKNNIRKLCRIADVVTVSTNFLKQKLSEFNTNVITVPNAFDEKSFNRIAPTVPRPKIINWRGSKTHQRDVFGVALEIIQLAHRYPSWTWNFIGDNLWFLTEKMPRDRTICIAPIDLINYFAFAQKLSPSIQIVPLADSPFNRSKSNIAWMEGVYAGSQTLAPDWEEWRKPGCVNYTDSKDFGSKLEKMMLKFENGSDYKLENQEAWDYIQNNLTLTKTNQTRMEILTKLCRT